MLELYRKFRNWFLCKYCGYIRLSDVVTVSVILTPPAVQPKFNLDLIVGKKDDT